MANDDAPFDPLWFLNGVPIELTDAEPDDWPAFIKGGKRLGPVEITGHFDDGRVACAICRELFTPGPEGRAFVECDGERIGPVCPACGAAVVG